jgi:hypothetical protein
MVEFSRSEAPTRKSEYGPGALNILACTFRLIHISCNYYSYWSRRNVVVLTISPSLCFKALFANYLELLRRDAVDQTIFVGGDFGGLEGRRG